MLECLRNPSVIILIFCQSLGIAIATIVVSTGGTIGLDLTGNPRWSTLPITCYVLGTFLMLFPASKLCGLLGRKHAFLIGSFVGVIGGIVFYGGIANSSLFFVCVGTLIIGFQRSFVEYYRFAVVELVSDQARAFAMSLVISGGVFAAFLGPNLARYSKDFQNVSSWLQKDFSATALVVTLICLIQFSLFMLIYQQKKETINKKDTKETIKIQQNIKNLRGGARSQAMGLELLGDYRHYILMAIMITSAGSALMTFLMNAAPIAMQHEFSLSFDQAAQTVQWHVFAMYFPSFFTGFLLKRWRCLPLAMAGLFILGLAAIVGFFANTHLFFVLSLVLLGIGWNLCYFTGSYLLVQVTPLSKKNPLCKA